MRQVKVCSPVVLVRHLTRQVEVMGSTRLVCLHSPRSLSKHSNVCQELPDRSIPGRGRGDRGAGGGGGKYNICLTSVRAIEDAARVLFGQSMVTHT